MNAPTPCLSFIGIVDFSQEAKWLFCSDSVADLLGYEPKELVGSPSLNLVHPDEFPRVRQLHYDTIQQDKAAVLVYLRMKHKDPARGYILCGISRTVVHNVLVGSVSFASPGAKALHNASTAQEITVITPSAANFEFRRWHDPSPMPPSPIPEGMGYPASPSPSSSSSDTTTTSPRSTRSTRRLSSSSDRSASPSPPRTHTRTRTPSAREPTITFHPLSNKSFRTAFILDRFSVHCKILFCSNDLLVSSMDAVGRPFFDFVARKDEETVRQWIGCVKGWGVNEKGQPSDGGFGFGKFVLLTERRESVARLPDPRPQRNRNGSTTGRGSTARTARQHTANNAVPNAHRDRDAHHRDRDGHHRDRDAHLRDGPIRDGPIRDAHRERDAHRDRDASYRDRDRDAHATSRSPPRDPGEQIDVDAIFSAHSDGLMVILRRAS